MKNTQNARLTFGKRLNIWIVDVTAVFFFFHVIRFLIAWFLFLPFLPSFLIVWLLYYIIAFSIWKQTLGTAFFGVHMISSGHENSSWLRIALKEWASLPTILLIGWYFIFYTPYHSVDYSNTLSVVGRRLVNLFSFLTIILFLFGGKIFRLKLVRNTDTDINREKKIQKQVFTAYLILLLCGTGARYFHTSCTNDIEEMRASSMEEPYRSVHIVNSVEAWDWRWFTTPRPMGHSVKKYVNFLKNNRQDINE